MFYHKKTSKSLGDNMRFPISQVNYSFLMLIMGIGIVLLGAFTNKTVELSPLGFFLVGVGAGRVLRDRNTSKTDKKIKNE